MSDSVQLPQDAALGKCLQGRYTKPGTTGTDLQPAWLPATLTEPEQNKKTNKKISSRPKTDSRDSRPK